MALQNDPNSYYTDRSGWSNSMFKKLIDNPYAFHKWYVERTVDPVNNVFSKGQYLHDYMARMIDPNYESECQFLILPKLNKTTKAGKEKFAELTKDVDLDVVYIVSENEKADLERLADSFLQSPEWGAIMRNGRNIFVEREFRRIVDGLELKGKLDFGCEFGDKRITLDWKTSSNFSEFANKARWYDYDRQASIYNYISRSDIFYFVVFDVVEMNRWKIVEIAPDGEFINRGWNKTLKAIELAKTYLDVGINDKCWRKEVLL